MKRPFKVGDIVALLSKHMPSPSIHNHYDYGIVERFYPLDDSGEGVTIKGLTLGLHSCSQPLDDLSDWKVFKNLQEAQSHIDSFVSAIV